MAVSKQLLRCCLLYGSKVVLIGRCATDTEAECLQQNYNNASFHVAQVDSSTIENLAERHCAIHLTLLALHHHPANGRRRFFGSECGTRRRNERVLAALSPNICLPKHGGPPRHDIRRAVKGYTQSRQMRRGREPSGLSPPPQLKHRVSCRSV